MLTESEKALNASDGMAVVRHDESPCPLFERAEWFSMLHAGCLADIPRVTIADASGRCVLELLEPEQGQLRTLSNWYSFRWRPSFVGPFNAEALHSACSTLRARAWSFRAEPVPEDDALVLATALRATGWCVRCEAVSANCWVDTQKRSFETWWAERPGQLRSTVARKAKRQLVTIAIHTAFSEAAWADYELVYAQSWKPQEGSPDFLRDWARDAGQRGSLRLGIATMDGRPVAAQFWTIEADIASIHKLAQVKDADVDSASAGTLLTHAMYRHAFDVDHVTRVDFGTGNERFKADWTEGATALYQVVALDLRHWRAWQTLAGHLFTRLAAKLRRG